MLGSAGYQMVTAQGKMPCELGVAEKTGITRIMAEIRLKIVITKGNIWKAEWSPNKRRVFLKPELNRLGLGQRNGPSGAQYLLCPNRQFACISGITSPTDSLVFYNSYPYICLEQKNFFLSSNTLSSTNFRPSYTTIIEEPFSASQACAPVLCIRDHLRQTLANKLRPG